MKNNIPCGGEKFLSRAVVYKIKFPEFWQKACREKNGFYNLIEECAFSFVKETGRGQEYLEGEKIRHFWHEHCYFCWDKATADKDCIFYCTEDMKYWFCEKCFNDYKDKFGWTVKSGEELCAKPLHYSRAIIIADK